MQTNFASTLPQKYLLPSLDTYLDTYTKLSDNPFAYTVVFSFISIYLHFGANKYLFLSFFTRYYNNDKEGSC